ncbi:MAG: biliverdin-producing heme oxygenase [Pseudomonadota bacterium]
MASDRRDKEAKTLRQHLRGATASAHDTLDTSMRPASDWSSRDDYARFLSTQYAARGAVEHWLSVNAPKDLFPPEQTPLLERDLAALGSVIEEKPGKLALTYEGEATAIGVAWVLAGSSLGNRAMLHEMQRTLPEGTQWPHEFLSSRAMTEFWKALRARVEVPVSEEEAGEATRAATCVFEHFLKFSQPQTADPVMVDAR